MVRFAAQLLWVFGFLAIPAFGQADQDTQKSMEILSDASKNTWNTVLQKRFADAARNSSDANQIRAIQLRVLRNFEVNSGAGDGEIVLAAGLLFEVNAMADGELLVEQGAADWRELVERYADYLVATHRRATSDHPQLVKTFAQFEGIPQATVVQIVATPGYGQRKQKLMLDSMSWLFGHEVGHIVLHHPKYNQISRTQAQSNEFAADKFGYDIAEKSGFTPSAAFVTVFPVFIAMESGAMISPPNSTHPSANCRISALLPENLKKILSHSDSADTLSKIGMTPAQFADNAATLKDVCRD